MKELMPYIDREDKFRCCEPIGFLGWPLSKCCDNSENQDEDEDNNISHVSKFQQELGIGISLYF